MLIQAHQLRKSYRMGLAEVEALRGVDLEVAHGEFVAIVGASGSGKSTLLHLLGCLDRPSGGWYRLDGTAVEALSDTELSRVRNQRIGFVFQTFNLIPQHDVLANVELPLIYSGMSKMRRRQRSLAMLRRVGLGERTQHRPTELSGGENQRAAIARALAIEPALLLADEPTGNLDTRTGAGIMNLFLELHRTGTTIVVVTHNREVAIQTERIIEMSDGRIVSDSTNAPSRG
jgi:putative ABC transport system ATP-binding protein